MRIFSWHRLLLPLTIAAMLSVFAQKAADFARAATWTSGGQAPPPTSGLSSPEPSNAAALSSTPRETTPAAELALLADLRKRREALDARAKALDGRAELLSAAERKLRGKLEDLTTLQTRLEQLEQSRHQRESANWAGLVKTYEDMKPRDASAIFNVLDIDVLLEVLDRMEDRKVALILAGMLPERARQVTQMLARKRVEESSVISPQDLATAAPAGHS